MTTVSRTTTKLALRSSIEKWEKNLTVAESRGDDLTTRDLVLGASNCPLCNVFNSLTMLEAASCVGGCPVYVRTGKQFCEDTPYDEIDNFKVKTAAELLELVRKEVDFLKSLEADL